MNKKELDFILKKGEGLKVEFKEALDPKSLARELAAFANSEGGRVLLGVKDNAQVKGIKIDNKMKSEIQDVARNCDPPIQISLESFKNILVINVEEGKNKPYRCSAGFFLRQGTNSQKLSTQEIRDFFDKEGKILFDERESPVKGFCKDLVAAYLKMAGIDASPDKATLINLGALSRKGFLNNSGVLFFTKAPKKVVVNAYITCARYKGTEKVNVIDRKDFEGDLISQVRQALEFVKRNTRLEYKIKGLYRHEIPEYPAEAVREAVLNAVMHRDYNEKGANVQIDIFDDRLTVTNIGGLIKPLTKEKLGTLAVRRNPLIADLFHRIHFVEKMGSGIKRIREECRKHGNVRFEVETNGYFVAKFKLGKRLIAGVGEKVGEKVGENLSGNQQAILRIISENRFVSIKELSKKIGIAEKNIEVNLAKLKEKGLLKRIGPDKGGHWEISRKFIKL